MLPPALAMFLAALAFQGEVHARCSQAVSLSEARKAVASSMHAVVGPGGDFEEAMDRLEGEVQRLAIDRCAALPVLNLDGKKGR